MRKQEHALYTADAIEALTSAPEAIDATGFADAESKLISMRSRDGEGANDGVYLLMV